MVKANFSGIVHILPATLPLGHLRSACEGEFLVPCAFGKSSRISETGIDFAGSESPRSQRRPRDSKTVYYHFIGSQSCLISWFGSCCFQFVLAAFLEWMCECVSWCNLNPGIVLLSFEYTLQGLSLIKKCAVFPLEYVHVEGKWCLFVR